MRTRAWTISWIVLTVLVLAAAYLGSREWLAHEDPDGARSRHFELTAAPLLPGEEPPVFQAKQDDSVTFIIRADRSGELHVHGYETMIALEAGRVATLSLVVTNAGLFALHLHDPGGRMHGLATLEVRPR